MTEVNRDILLMVLFILSCAALAVAIVDDKKVVFCVGSLIGVITCVACFYLLAIRGY